MTRTLELEVILYGCLVEFGNPSDEDGNEWKRFYDQAYALLDLPRRVPELKALAYPSTADQPSEAQK